MKKLIKILIVIIIAAAAVAAVFIGYLTITEFRPEAVENVEVQASGESSGKAEAAPREFTVMSWNIGYAGLSEENDFFMDGGKNVRATSEEKVQESITGIIDTIAAQNADICMLQEVDENSTRSFHIDQTAAIRENKGLKNANSTFALNYSCPWVPYPWPMIGKVNSGLMVATDYEITSAERISLPCPFSWPIRIANLKRCMLANYMPLKNGKTLVLVNFHLEAYDDGQGKIAQTKQLLDFIESEYDKGNYVIAGGDWNQVFPGSLQKYPNNHPDCWNPGVIEPDKMPEGWSLCYDISAPTTRVNNQPYDRSDTENTQHHVIDGFICSPNMEVDSVRTIDEYFRYSDHNPVKIKVTLE